MRAGKIIGQLVVPCIMAAVCLSSAAIGATRYVPPHLRKNPAPPPEPDQVIHESPTIPTGTPPPSAPTSKFQITRPVREPPLDVKLAAKASPPGPDGWSVAHKFEITPPVRKPPLKVIGSEEAGKMKPKPGGKPPPMPRSLVPPPGTETGDGA
ncbi:MAG: hypothetical protein LBJ69_00340 [Holosporales bacterium]|jgi:hypothetical protein|nr:hypothetical protein [Holosporales bacterium]